jgi:hypothetical protein
MDWRNDLLTLSDGYRAAKGLSESRIASLVGGTGIFFRRIRAGGDCSATVYQRALRWFSEHWPDGTDWPSGVIRPSPLNASRRDAA